MMLQWGRNMCEKRVGESEGRSQAQVAKLRSGSYSGVPAKLDSWFGLF